MDTHNGMSIEFLTCVLMERLAHDRFAKGTIGPLVQIGEGDATTRQTSGRTQQAHPDENMMKPKRDSLTGELDDDSGTGQQLSGRYNSQTGERTENNTNSKGTMTPSSDAIVWTAEGIRGTKSGDRKVTIDTFSSSKVADFLKANGLSSASSLYGVGRG